MINMAIFASGNGSNFQAIVDSELKQHVKLLVCDNKDAYVIERAKQLEIVYFAFNPKDYDSKIEYEKVILSKLRELKIDFIALAGYMRLLSELIVDEYQKRIVNIHPSKLPDYKGINAIERAYEAGEAEIGVSIHYVDYGMDTGEVIASETVQVNNDSLDKVTKRVHILEHILYVRTLKQLVKEK